MYFVHARKEGKFIEHLLCASYLSYWIPAIKATSQLRKKFALRINMLTPKQVISLLAILHTQNLLIHHGLHITKNFKVFQILKNKSFKLFLAEDSLLPFLSSFSYQVFYRVTQKQNETSPQIHIHFISKDWVFQRLNKRQK